MQFTVKQFAEKFQVSTTEANGFLKVLVTLGRAKIEKIKKEGQRGKPTNKYILENVDDLLSN